MPLDVRNLPKHLFVGEKSPKSFSAVLEALKVTPAYKVAVFSADRFQRQYRIYNHFYIAPIAKDPSNVRKFMAKVPASESNCFEDGKRVEAMTGFRILLTLADMANFSSAFVALLNQNLDNYVYVAHTGVVQYSSLGEVVTVFAG